MSKRGVNGAPPAAPLAFTLRGEVDARGPLKRIKATAPLYEFQEFEVKLTNPFEVGICKNLLLAKSIGFHLGHLNVHRVKCNAEHKFLLVFKNPVSAYNLPTAEAMDGPV